MDLMLLRHGETEWNLTGRMQGTTDTKLTDVGIEQAHQAAAKMPSFSQIWTSPLQRARKTAEIVAATQGLDYTSDRRLSERSWGEWEGRLPEEVDQDWPGWRQSGKKPRGYEDDKSVFLRFRSWINVASEHDPKQPLLAVTHGGFIAAVIRTIGGRDTGFKNLEGVWIAVTNTEFSVLRHEEFIADARRLTR